MTTKPLKLVLKEVKDPYSSSSLKHIKPVIVTPTSAQSRSSLKGLPDIHSPTSLSASPQKKIYRIEGRKSEILPMGSDFMRISNPNNAQDLLESTEFKRNPDRKHAATTIFENKSKIPFNIFSEHSLAKHKMLPVTSRVGTLESIDNQSASPTHKIRTVTRSFTTRERDQSQDSPQYRNISSFLDNSPTTKRSQTMMPQSPQSNFSLPPIGWPANPEQKEESKARNHSIRKLVEELQEERYVQSDHLNFKENQKLQADETERVIAIAEEILPVMNIKVRSKMDVVHDSVMVIQPIEDRNNLAVFYKSFVPVLCQIPFGFLSKIRISLITVCQQIDLFSSNYMGILEQKLLNGLFVMKRLSTKEQIRDHLYRIVLYHFIKKKTGFYDEWKSLWADMQIQYKYMGRTTAYGTRRVKPTAFGDLLLAFKKGMAMSGKSSPRNQSQDGVGKELVEFLRDHLIEFDRGSFAAEEDEENDN